MEVPIRTDRSATGGEAQRPVAALEASARRTGRLIELCADVDASKYCVPDWTACATLLGRVCDALTGSDGYCLARISVDDASIEGGYAVEAKTTDCSADAIETADPASHQLVAFALGSASASRGSLFVCPDAADVLEANERALLSLIASGLGHALDRIFAEDPSAARALQLDDELFRECFEGVSVGMIILRGHDEPLLVNRALSAFLGREQEWFDQTPAIDALQQISHPADYREERGSLHRLMDRQQGSYTIEKRFVRGDGSMIYGLQTTTFFFDPQGGFRFGVVSIQDTTEYRRTRGELRTAYEGAIDGMVAALESRDPYTVGHQHRVAQLACAIAERLDLSEHRTTGLRVASTLHDIGKIAIPAEILTKPYGMSEAEFTLVRDHPRVAYEILREIRFPWPVADIVLQHHERMDGSGYPKGLTGDAILLEARILAVSDTVEALASHRPYRPALTVEQALRHITEMRGELFDGDVVDACVEAFDNGFAFQEVSLFPDGRTGLI